MPEAIWLVVWKFELPANLRKEFWVQSNLTPRSPRASWSAGVRQEVFLSFFLSFFLFSLFLSFLFFSFFLDFSFFLFFSFLFISFFFFFSFLFLFFFFFLFLRLSTYRTLLHRNWTEPNYLSAQLSTCWIERIYVSTLNIVLDPDPDLCQKVLTTRLAGGGGLLHYTPGLTCQQARLVEFPRASPLEPPLWCGTLVQDSSQRTGSFNRGSVT